MHVHARFVQNRSVSFCAGGPNCLRVLLPPLVISACRLLPSVIERQQQAEQRIQDVTPPAHGGKKICQFMHSTCLELVQIDAEVRMNKRLESTFGLLHLANIIPILLFHVHIKQCLYLASTYI